MYHWSGRALYSRRQSRLPKSCCRSGNFGHSVRYPPIIAQPIDLASGAVGNRKISEQIVVRERSSRSARQNRREAPPPWPKKALSHEHIKCSSKLNTGSWQLIFGDMQDLDCAETIVVAVGMLTNKLILFSLDNCSFPREKLLVKSCTKFPPSLSRVYSCFKLSPKRQYPNVSQWYIYIY